MQSEFTEPSCDSSTSSDELTDRNSPSSIMEIDAIYPGGDDLRAGAHFFPSGNY